MYIILVLAALGLLTVVIAKIKSLFFKAKDTKLVKEDSLLSKKQTEAQVAVIQAKSNIKAGNVKLVTPEEVEDFWNKDKK